MKFEDHFSKQASDYVTYRPKYPLSLYKYLASLAPGRDFAWDCGTGNGQAALGLAGCFRKVLATDASPEQIERAFQHERVEYRVRSCEQSGLEDASVDLVAVAAAVHWFDFDRFYLEVQRVLKKDGILAVWAYRMPSISDQVDQVARKFSTEVLAGYWPERIRYINDDYRSLPFPFREVEPPPFELEAEWDLDQLVGFLASWSAVRRYQDENRQHPVELIWDELAAAWGRPDQKRRLHWPLFMRIGINSGG
jgi:SAM-dependent methyltransferase